MNYIARIQKAKSLNGAQKSAIMFLCIGEEHGSALMQKLEASEIMQITKAISDMGEVPSGLVDDVMKEFESKVGDVGGVFGTVDAARALLGRFLPEDRVEQILIEIDGGKTGDLWKDLSEIDANVLAEYLDQERNQTVAVILSRLTAEKAAKVLPYLGQDRMASIIERIAGLSDLPTQAIENIENSLRQGLLGSDGQSVESEIESHLVNIFNKLDTELIDGMANELEQSIPDKFRLIKQQMFVFDDLIKLKPNVLALVMREAGRKTLPLALRGAEKETRDHFLNSLPQRSRDMLQEEMKAMGPVRSRDVKEAQSELVEITIRLAAAGQIEMPTEETTEEMIE